MIPDLWLTISLLFFQSIAFHYHATRVPFLSPAERKMLYCFTQTFKINVCRKREREKKREERWCYLYTRLTQLEHEFLASFWSWNTIRDEKRRQHKWLEWHEHLLWPYFVWVEVFHFFSWDAISFSCGIIFTAMIIVIVLCLHFATLDFQAAMESKRIRFQNKCFPYTLLM